MHKTLPANVVPSSHACRHARAAATQLKTRRSGVATHAMEVAVADLARPDDESRSALDAWLMDASTADQRLPHRRAPSVRVSPPELAALGVLHWFLPPQETASHARLAAIRSARGYSFDEMVTISRDTLPDYEAKLAAFFAEHIHADEEVRYILEGSGYFDVRSEGVLGEKESVWVRVATQTGDLIVLPAGCYHRFTLDEGNYVKAVRLFVGPPVWTPIGKTDGAEDHAARVAYLATLRT